MSFDLNDPKWHFIGALLIIFTIFFILIAKLYRFIIFVSAYYLLKKKKNESLLSLGPDSTLLYSASDAPLGSVKNLLKKHPEDKNLRVYYKLLLFYRILILRPLLFAAGLGLIVIFILVLRR